jgi:hypothetical protein
VRRHASDEAFGLPDLNVVRLFLSSRLGDGRRIVRELGVDGAENVSVRPDVEKSVSQHGASGPAPLRPLTVRVCPQQDPQSGRARGVFMAPVGPTMASATRSAPTL